MRYIVARIGLLNPAVELRGCDSIPGKAIEYATRRCRLKKVHWRPEDRERHALVQFTARLQVELVDRVFFKHTMAGGQSQILPLSSRKSKESASERR